MIKCQNVNQPHSVNNMTADILDSVHYIVEGATNTLSLF